MRPGLRTGTVQYPVVVITAGDGELLVLVFNAFSDGVRRAEIKRSPCDWRQVACGDEYLVHGSVAVRVDLDFMVQDGAIALTRQVEVGVVGQVQHRRLCGRGAVLDFEVVTVQRVGDVRRQLAGVALVTVRRNEGELHAIGQLLRAPDAVIEAVGTAVQGLAVVVDGHVVRVAVDGEFALGNAVAVPANDRAEVRAAVILVCRCGGMAEGDVGNVAVAVRASMAWMRAPRVMRCTCSSGDFSVYMSTALPPLSVPKADLVTCASEVIAIVPSASSAIANFIMVPLARVCADRAKYTAARHGDATAAALPHLYWM